MKKICVFWSGLNAMLRNKEARYCTPQMKSMHLRYVAFFLFVGVYVYLHSWDVSLALASTGFLVAGYLILSLFGLAVALSLRGRLLPKRKSNKQARLIDHLLLSGYDVKQIRQLHSWYARSVAEHYSITRRT